MLPEAAEDDKEYRFGAVGNRKKIKRLLTQLTQKFI
jgi:hypothetical protein